MHVPYQHDRPTYSADCPRKLIRCVAGMAFNFSATNLKPVRIPAHDGMHAPRGFKRSDSGMHFLRMPDLIPSFG